MTRLDRVGDDLAADERGAHALVAHADAVADGDRAELHAGTHRQRRTPALARSASLRSVMLHGVTSFHDVGEADLRLHPVVVGHADGAQHRAGRGLLEAVGDVAAAGLHIDRGAGSGGGT